MGVPGTALISPVHLLHVDSSMLGVWYWGALRDVGQVAKVGTLFFFVYCYRLRSGTTPYR